VLVGRDAQAAGGPHRTTAEARGADVVGRPVAATAPPGVSPGEHLERAGHVQALHLVEQDHQDGAHASKSDLAPVMAAMTNTQTFLPSVDAGPGRVRSARCGPDGPGGPSGRALVAWMPRSCC